MELYQFEPESDHEQERTPKEVQIKIKIRFYCHVDTGNTQNYSSAFNPSRLPPVEHTHAHAQGHTLMETASGGTVPCSRAPPLWQGGGLPPLQLSLHQSLSGERGNQPANLPVRQPTLTTATRQ